MKRFLLLTLLLGATSSYADETFVTPGYWPTGMGNGGGFTSFEIGDGNDAVAAVVQCRAAGSVTDVCARYQLKNGASTLCNQIISIEGIEADGDPDGSIASSGNAKATINPPDDTTWNGTTQCFTLTSAYTCVAGAFFSIRIMDDSSDGCTPTATTNASTWSYDGGGATAASFPYGLTTADGSAWTKRARYPFFAYKIGSSYYGWPVKDNSTAGFEDSTNPDERGNRWLANGCSRSILGAKAWFTTAAIGGSYKIIAYASGSNVEELTVDTDQVGLVAAIGNPNYFFLDRKSVV